MQPSGRIYYLDAARAILMLIGIPYHLALVYKQSNEWHFATSPQTSLFLAYLADVIHTFRMPAFFALAGYFAMMMLERKSARSWLGDRTVRLLLPLLATGLLLNPISLFAQEDDGVLLFTTLGDHWLAHLWFLPALLLMFAFLALMQGTPLLRWFQSVVQWAARYPGLGVLLLIVVATGVAGIGSLLDSRLPKVFALRMVLPAALGSMPFLLLGAAMRSNREVLDFMSRWSWVGLVLTVLPLWFFVTTSWGGSLVNLARVLATTLVSIGMGRIVLAACKMWLDRPSGGMRKLVAASFTIYLVHFPILNLFFMLLEPANLPVWLEYTVLVGAVTAASYGVHLLIARSGILLFMFNGVPLRKEPAITIA